MSIMLCYDGSPSAARAIETVSKVMRDQEVALVYVWNAPVPYLSDSFSDPGGRPAVKEIERTSLEFAQQRLTEGATAARAAGLRVTTHLQQGEPSVGQAILDTAAALDVDTIVIGTHGHTAVQEQLLGSVSSEVLHNATRPVLIVPSN